MHVSVGEGIAIVVFAGILLLATVNVLVVATGRPRFAMPPPPRRRSRR